MGHPLPFMVMDAGVNDGWSSPVAPRAASSAVTTTTSVAPSAENLVVPSALGTPFVALASLRPGLKTLEVVGVSWARSPQGDSLLTGGSLGHCPEVAVHLCGEHQFLVGTGRSWGPLTTTLPLLCKHIKRTWVVINLGSLLALWAIISTMWGMIEVGEVPSCTLAMPRSCQSRASSPWWSMTIRIGGTGSPGSVFRWSPGSACQRAAQDLLKTSFCTACIVASRRLSIILQSATSNDPAWSSWNMPAANFNCFTLLGLGILATSIMPPTSLSN